MIERKVMHSSAGHGSEIYLVYLREALQILDLVSEMIQHTINASNIADADVAYKNITFRKHVHVLVYIFFLSISIRNRLVFILFLLKTWNVGTCYNRLAEKVLTSIYSLYFGAKIRKITYPSFAI